MELKEIIEKASEKIGSQKKLADHLGMRPQEITDAKNGRKGMPLVACGKLAEILEIDRWTVAAASDLVTEKNEEKRAYLLPFVRHAAAIGGIFVLASVTNVMTAKNAEASEIAPYRAGEASRNLYYVKLLCAWNTVKTWFRQVVTLGKDTMQAAPVQLGFSS